jgi:kinesin family protein 3/17
MIKSKLKLTFSSKQDIIYEETAMPIVDFVLEGYNGTIFAYGQTGTGKTFTMEGDDKIAEQGGIMPRSFETIFKAIEADPSKQYLVRASYMELYKEDIRDLLSKNPKNKLEIREKPDVGVYIKDLCSFVVRSVKEIKEIMYTGRENRTTAETKMNLHSSRSHSIFTVTIETAQMGVDLKSHIRAGKLNMVDLAGSERQQKTEAVGIRLEEAAKINLSLSTLCHVISTLTDPKGGSHIPYRNSKLTRILQDSLGGNTKTVMVANIGPADFNYEESLNTIRYANRAKNIMNKPRINEDPKDAMIREFQEEIMKLRELLAQKLGKVVMKDGQIVSLDNNEQTMQKQMEEELAKQTEELRKKQEEIDRVEAEGAMVKEEKEKLLEALNKQKEDQEKVKKECEDLMAKKQQLQDRILQGNEEMKKAREKEQEKIKKGREKLAKIQEKREKMAEQIKKKEVDAMHLVEKFSSLHEELDYKTKKIAEIDARCKEAQAELDERNEEFRKQNEDLFKSVREYKMELELKRLVISYLEHRLLKLTFLKLNSKNSEHWQCGQMRQRIGRCHTFNLQGIISR